MSEELKAAQEPCSWSDAQVLEFLGVALRNVDIVGSVRLSEIRQGFEHMQKLYAAPVSEAKAQADKPSYASQMAKRGGSIMPEAQGALPKPWQCETAMCPDLYTAQQMHEYAKAQGVVMPERWNVPRPMWKDARQPYGNPLNHADIEAAEKFNLALDEVARLNAAPVQQVSVPDEVVIPTALFDQAISWIEDRRRYGDEGTLHQVWHDLKTIQQNWRAAAPAAPAADAGLVEALITVAHWNLPETGQFWPSGHPVSYESQHGSNGARDYMREVAQAALAAHRAKGVA